MKGILMDALFRKSDRLLANTSTEIVRDKMNEIHWGAQLVSIVGAKGVGKSTHIHKLCFGWNAAGNARPGIRI